MTLDKNGKAILCGDIVKIEGAYFKNDCGYWFVEQDGTNESYIGNGLTLKKIGKRGKISTAKYSLAFWPLCSFCSDRVKNAEANAHNEKYATIEIVYNIDNTAIIDWIRSEIESNQQQIDYWELHFGEGYESPNRKSKAYFEKALMRLTAEEAPEAVEIDENDEMTEEPKEEPKSTTEPTTSAGKEPLKPEELTGVFGEIVKGVEKLEEIASETPEQFAARCEAKAAEIFPAEKVEAITEGIMNGVNAILNGADTSETVPPEEIPTEDETTTGAATETQETASNTAPDMFAELAKAYFTGKTAPGSRAKAKKEAEPKNDTTETGTTATEGESEPEKPPKTAPGYTGETSDILSTEEAERLTNGEQVKRNDEETRYNRIFTAARYTDRTALLYSIDRYQYRDEPREALQPGDDFHYIGFITCGKTYTNADVIREEMREDIAEAIRQMIPDEETARANAESCEEWQRHKIESAEEYGANNAADLFYKDEPPTLYLYDKSANIPAADVIRYIENPAQVVTEYATEYAQSHAADIAAAYIKYNLLTAALNTIKADKAHPAHIIKKIARCIGETEKTARIELNNGETVTAEANAVRYITRGYISEWYIKAADRQKLNKDERGRAQDIKPEEIKAIYHGQRTLYRAA